MRLPEDDLYRVEKDRSGQAVLDWGCIKVYKVQFDLVFDSKTT